MADPLLVVHLEPPHHGGQGDSIYRTVQPCRALGQLPGVEVVAGSFISPAVHRLLPIADVVVLCDVVEADLIPLLRQRRENGFPTIYEINDDFQALPPWNPTAYLASNPFTRSLSSRLAACCGNLQFSTPYLAGLFGAMASQQAVFVNNLWEMPPCDAKRLRPGVRIGWGGSLGHRDDFTRVIDVMRHVLERYPDVTFNVMGDTIYRDLCRTLPEDRYSYRKGGDLSEYLSFVSTLDIGLCPLDDTDFNRGRSDVKFLEYASHGVVTVAADLPPYQASIRNGETGLLFRYGSGLAQLLGELIECPERRKDIGSAGRTYVRDHRLEREHIQERLAFMKECLRRREAPPHNQASSNRCWPRNASRSVASVFHLGNESRIFADSSARFCTVDELGGELLDGLAALRDGDQRRAQASFRSASERAPRFYLPWLYRGNIEDDHRRAVGLLDTALDLQPLSVAALLVRADRFEAMGNVDAARVDLARADQLAPELGLPLARLAEMAEREGDTKLALELEVRVLNQNAYYALPHIRRVLNQVDRGVSPDITALEYCLKHDDRFWGTRFVLAKAALATNSPRLAREHLLVALKYAPDPAPVMAQLARVEMVLGDYTAAQTWLEAAKAHPQPVS